MPMYPMIKHINPNPLSDRSNELRLALRDGQSEHGRRGVYAGVYAGVCAGGRLCAGVPTRLCAGDEPS